MQGTDKINTITNIVFVLADVLESNLINMQEEFKKTDSNCGTRRKGISTLH